MEFHKYANLFPLMEGDEFEDLVEDIDSRGLLEPIVMYEGKILDGRNRYRALAARGRGDDEIKELGFTDEYEGNDPLGFVVSKNMHRRHLTQSQKAIIAVQAHELMTELHSQAEERRLYNLTLSPLRKDGMVAPPPGGAHGKVRQQVAAMAGVGESLIQRAQVILQEAPELVPRIASGELQVGTAYGSIERDRDRSTRPNERFAGGGRQRNPTLTEQALGDYNSAYAVLKGLFVSSGIDVGCTALRDFEDAQARLVRRVSDLSHLENERNRATWRERNARVRERGR